MLEIDNDDFSQMSPASRQIHMSELQSAVLLAKVLQGSSSLLLHSISRSDKVNAQAHSNCSETFYKESLFNELSSRKEVSNEEKSKMLDMLKRLEEQEDPAEQDLDEVEKGADLMAALQAMELGECIRRWTGFSSS